MNRFRQRYRSRQVTSQGHSMILAHRGDSFRAPENTMEAARLGLEAGADAWELDVQLTRDGHPVVIHDETLSRTTDARFRFAGDDRGHSGFSVDRFTLDEVRSLDAGSWFVDAMSTEPRSAKGFGTLEQLKPADLSLFRSGTVRVPTLGEALRWTVEVDWLVNVEIKPNTENSSSLVAIVLEAIDRERAWDHVTVSSFDHRVVETIALCEPRVATGALISGPLLEATESWIDRLKIDAVHGPPWCAEPKTGRTLMIYTVNDSAPGGLASRLMEAGVAGLFTDDPLSIIKESESSRSSARTRSHSGKVGRRPDDR